MEFEFLKGKKISGCRYMTDLEAEEYGFYKKPLVIVFEGGHAMFAVTDDECNDGGSFLFLDKEDNKRPGFVEKLIYTI